jgi:hypothetical protein
MAEFGSWTLSPTTTFAEGREDDLLSRLEERLGKSKEEVRREIEELWDGRETGNGSSWGQCAKTVFRLPRDFRALFRKALSAVFAT